MAVSPKLLAFSLVLIGVTYLIVDGSVTPASDWPNEKYANLQEGELDMLRYIIHKACTMYTANYQMIGIYIYGQWGYFRSGNWNVAVYKKQDWNTNFYLTGMYDETHQNKRYYQVIDVETFNVSILILQTNNTDGNISLFRQQKEVRLMERVKAKSLRRQPQIKWENGLQYTKKKSPNVTTAQEAGIDLAMTTAYTWNKNIIDFTKVVQRLTETNLNQRWQVCTRYEALSNFGFYYNSVYGEWVEYIGYGLGSYVLHVYLYRNYING